jgi:solute carrier family 25 (mitochondrial oxoglutarate transporter), member 11
MEDNVKAKEKRNLTFGEKVAYSLFTGAVGSVIANPTDMALIRFQSDNNLPAAERRNYKNVFDALGRIYSEEGLAGMWRGSVPTIGRAMAVNCSHLVGYNESKEQIMKYTGEKKETMSIRLTASAISGIAVSLCSLPFDNVKTKILKMKKSKGGCM